MRAADLRERITFSKRAPINDGHGNPVSGPFIDQFTVFAQIHFVRGGEEILAKRLAGTQPVVITVRRNADTASVAPDWRAVDANDATRIFNVRSITPDEKKRQIDFLCERGVAV